jgi:hypothetical protein
MCGVIQRIQIIRLNLDSPEIALQSFVPASQREQNVTAIVIRQRKQRRNGQRFLVTVERLRLAP